MAILSLAYTTVLDHRSSHLALVPRIPFTLAKENVSGVAYQMFLQVDTVDGDSADQKHHGEIDVDSFAWSQVRGASASKPTMDGFRVTMPMSSASPKLFLYSAGGTKIPRAVLTVRAAGSQQDFLKWMLTDVRIVSYQTVGNTRGDGVQDQIVLGFGKVDVEYRPVLPNGTVGPAVQAGWDLRTGKSS